MLLVGFFLSVAVAQGAAYLIGRRMVFFTSSITA